MLSSWRRKKQSKPSSLYYLGCSSQLRGPQRTQALLLIDSTVFPFLEIPEEPPLRDFPALAALPHDLRLSADHRGSAPVGNPQGMFPNSLA